MTPKIVAFSGPAGAGKSTASEVLEAEGFERVKFAAPLKAMLRGFYREIGLPDDMIERKIEGDLKEQPCEHLCGKSPRHAMLTLGTEWGRDLIGSGLWVRAWKTKAKLALKRAAGVVCDDLRFQNEEQTVRDLDGYICEIAGRDLKHVTTHRSATYKPKPHASIFNVGGESEFRARVKLYFFRGLL
jgi:hypothetical protein